MTILVYVSCPGAEKVHIRVRYYMRRWFVGEDIKCRHDLSSWSVELLSMPFPYSVRESQID